MEHMGLQYIYEEIYGEISSKIYMIYKVFDFFCVVHSETWVMTQNYMYKIYESCRLVLCDFILVISYA